MNTDALSSTRVGMFDAETNIQVTDFDSIGKAGRQFGYMKAFSYIVHSKKKIDVTWKGKNIKVYFKELS